MYILEHIWNTLTYNGTHIMEHYYSYRLFFLNPRPGAARDCLVIYVSKLVAFLVSLFTDPRG